MVINRWWGNTTTNRNKKQLDDIGAPFNQVLFSLLVMTQLTSDTVRHCRVPRYCTSVLWINYPANKIKVNKWVQVGSGSRISTRLSPSAAWSSTKQPIYLLHYDDWGGGTASPAAVSSQICPSKAIRHQQGMKRSRKSIYDGAGKVVRSQPHWETTWRLTRAGKVALLAWMTVMAGIWRAVLVKSCLYLFYFLILLH